MAREEEAYSSFIHHMRYDFRLESTVIETVFIIQKTTDEEHVQCLQKEFRHLQ